MNYLRERRIEKSFVETCNKLRALQDSFFNAYLKLDFLQKQSEYAKIFYRKRNLFFKSLQKSRRLADQDTKYTFIFKEIERASEIIFALHLLRFRVNDYAVFEICAREFQALLIQLDFLFTQLARALMKKRALLNTENLAIAIFDVEILYGNTLQIVVRDPLVFLFFIRNLYSLKNTFDRIGNLINVNSRPSNERVDSKQ